MFWKFFNNVKEFPQHIYDFNFEHKLSLSDLNEVDNDSIPDHDILTGGFSCQPFSIAGKREGFNDVRSTVFLTIVEIIKPKKPSIVI